MGVEVVETESGGGDGDKNILTMSTNNEIIDHDLAPAPRTLSSSSSSSSTSSNGDNTSEMDRAEDNIQNPREIIPFMSIVSNTNTNSNVESKTGWFTSGMLIVNAALGAGLLNFPQAFDQAGGVVVGTFVQFILMLFIIPALLILAYCSDFQNAKTLQEVLSSTWGKVGNHLTSICVAIYCFGTCITFIIIIGDQFDRVFASLYGPYFCHSWYLNRTFTMCASSIGFILPFCYPRKIDFLKHVSSVGVVAVIYVVLLIIAQYYKGTYVPGPIKTSPDEWTDVFLVVPVICFGYQCHVSIIPIYSCMKPRTLGNFSKSTALAIGICIFTYTVAATYGYLTFGSKITSDVLEAYDADDVWVLVAIIAIAIKTYTTYPIMLFCGREAVSNLWIVLSGLPVDSPANEKFRRFMIASVWFFLSLIFAVFLPNLGSAIKLLGALAAVFIFIFPGLCLLRIAIQKQDHEIAYGLRSNRITQSLIYLSGLFLSFGGFIFGVVFAQTVLYEFILPKSLEIPLCLINETNSELSSYYHNYRQFSYLTLFSSKS